MVRKRVSYIVEVSLMAGLPLVIQACTICYYCGYCGMFTYN